MRRLSVSGLGVISDPPVPPGGERGQRRAEQERRGRGEGAPPADGVEHQAAAGRADHDGELDDGDLKPATRFGLVVHDAGEPRAPPDRRGGAEEPPEDEEADDRVLRVAEHDQQDGNRRHHRGNTDQGENRGACPAAG